MIDRDGGGTIFRFCGGGGSCYKGGHRAYEGPPSPLTRENPELASKSSGNEQGSCSRGRLKGGQSSRKSLAGCQGQGP